MTSPKPELVAPILAVETWKHALLVKVQAAIVRLALERDVFGPGDEGECGVPEESRQGVVSNAWTILRCAGIIERLPLDYTCERIGVFGGRKMNLDPKAKGRWTAAYRLASRTLADKWLERHNLFVRTEESVEQTEMSL